MSAYHGLARAFFLVTALRGSVAVKISRNVYAVSVVLAQPRCRMCWSSLQRRGRRDRQYCSEKCRKRRYYVKRKHEKLPPDFYLRLDMLYNLVSMAASRVPQPATPADLALAVRRQIGAPFYVEWLPRLCARSGCVYPLRPHTRRDRAFCSNPCRQRAYRHAKRSASPCPGAGSPTLEVSVAKPGESRTGPRADPEPAPGTAPTTRRAAPT